MTHTPLGYPAAWLDDADRQGDSDPTGLVSVGSREAPAPTPSTMYLLLCGARLCSMCGEPRPAVELVPALIVAYTHNATTSTGNAIDIPFPWVHAARAGHHRPAHHKEPP